jgi:hypothetical protein
MKKSIQILLKEVQEKKESTNKSVFASIKGGLAKRLDQNDDGCNNTGDCTKSSNIQSCNNSGTCFQ